MDRILTAAQSRALAIGLLVLSVAVLYLLLVRPYNGALDDLQEKIDGLTDRIDRYRTMAVSRSAVEDRIDDINTNPAIAAMFLTANTPSLAAAELQQLVKRAVTGSGGQLVSTQPVGGVDNADLSAIRIRVVMRGDSQKLHKLFRVLEGSRPILTLDNLSIKTTRKYSKVAEAAGEQLTVSFELTGYLWDKDHAATT